MERRSKKLIKELRTNLKLDSGPLVRQESATVPSSEEAPLIGEREASPGEDKPESKESEDDDFGYDPERYVPFDEKMEFAEQIKRVTKEGLTQIVNYLKVKQPEALEDFGNDRLQIRIDMIEREAFNQCRELLTLNIKEAPNKRQKISASAPAK